MDDGSPELAVGFAIDFGDSFAELLRLNNVIDAATANAVKEFAAVQRASKGMIDVSGSTAQIVSYGNASKRELQDIRREKAQTEKAGEALIRQLDREAAAFGKTRAEMTSARGETIALAATQQGNIELADRMLAASRRRQFAAEAAAQAEQRAAAEVAVAMEAEARAIREAAFAHQMFEARVREGVRAMREQAAAARETQVATRAQADAAERLKASIDPAYAAQQRFNREMAEARTLISAGAISLDDYVGKLRMEQTALDATRGALGRQTSSAGANRAAMAGASYQVQDFFTQVSMGANPINAFAVQGGQLAGQFSNIEGKAGNLARFFIGPWGLAITAGLMLLGPLVGKLLEGNNALDDAVKKLKKDAAETDISAKAKDRFRLTQEGVNAAVLEGTEATQKAIEAQQTAAEQDNIAAKANFNEALSIRRKTQDRLRDTKALLEAQIVRATGPSQSSEIAALGLARARAQITKVEADLAKSEASVTAQFARVQETRIGLAEEAAKRLADPMERIKKQYKDEANVAMDAARVQIAAGRELTVAQANQLAQRLAAIKRNEAAAVNAYQATTSPARQTADQIGRNISLAEARRIAENVGGRVTSDQRSSADQKRLYDKYVAYKSGNGPWAALAAKPGTSNHELGQALDVAKSDGVTLKKLVAAYRAAGVKVVEALDEGSHYHIAWKKVGGAAREETAERTAAAKIISDQQREYEAAMKATDGYTAAQMKSAAETGKTSKEIRLMEDALQRLAAPTEAQKVALDQAAAAREAAFGKQAANDFQANILQPMRDELALIGLVGPERAAAALELEKQAFIAKNMDQGVEVATARWREYYAVKKQIGDAERDAQFKSTMADGSDRLAELREELRLVGATEEVRARALATLKAQQEVASWTGLDPEKAAAYVKLMGDIAVQGVVNAQAQDAYNASLTDTADRWDIIAGKVQSASSAMADAFGSAGRAIGDLASIYANYQASRERAEAEHAAAITKAGRNEKLLGQENARFALRSSGAQIEAYGDMVSAAKGFFKEGSGGYKALAAAEKVYRIAQFAMSLQAMVQSVLETTTHVTGAAARATADGTAGIAAQSKLPFPFNIAAMAATAAALVAAGISVFGGGGGGKNTLAKPNEGAGTILGDASAKSDSIKNAIDALKEVDTLTNNYARQMASSLRSIESQIGGIATLVVRAGDISASAGVTEGFKKSGMVGIVGSLLGSIPLIGGFLGGLFGTKTTVTGNGLYGGAQSLGGILSGGFDASYYSDIEKKKKFFGFTTGTKSSTQYGAADPTLENQFTLILRSFNDAITAAAGPLGEATGDVQARLNGFVVDIGKIDLKGLTGAEIQEKLSAVFGAAADNMANAAFPGVERFQKVGEGAFETLVRVASTVEAVTNALSQLGSTTAALGIDAKVGLADQFDSLSGFAGAVDAYFQGFYTKEEQAAAKAAQFGRVFDSLGLTVPSTLAGFRALVEAQDLTTAAGRAAYATLLQLAPAFADLKSSMDGAKSAADILSERQDLERRMLELQGNTAAIRALDLAKLDQSNRALQQQIYAIQDGQEAAKAADELRKAWVSVGDTIMDEVKRIRGLSDAGGNGSFASLMGQFNTATDAARGGDMEAAKALPGLSQALLSAAALVATSRQELDRVQAQTAASLETTNAALSALKTLPAAPAPVFSVIPPIAKAPTVSILTPAAPVSTASILDAAALSQAASAPPPAAANDDLIHEVKALRDEVSMLRTENTSGHAVTASNTGKAARVLENVTSASGGDSFTMVAAQ